MLEDNGNSLPKLGEHSHSHQPQVRQEQDYYTQGPAGQAYYQATATVPVAVPVTPLAPAPKPRIVKRRWSVDAPHPLLWVALGLSIVAVILGVPKGTLPTLTGRHRTLRVSCKERTRRVRVREYVYREDASSPVIILPSAPHFAPPGSPINLPRPLPPRDHCAATAIVFPEQYSGSHSNPFSAPMSPPRCSPTNTRRKSSSSKST